MVVIQGFDGLQPPLDSRQVFQRAQDPSPHPAGARRCAGLVQDGKEAELPAPVLQVGDELEVPLGCLIQSHDASIRIDAKRRHMIEGPLCRVPEVFQENAGRDHLRGPVLQPEPFQVCDSELPLQALAAGFSVEAPVGKPV